MALQINNDTIKFFFNQVRLLLLLQTYQRFNSFPLYATAIKFYNHPDSMVRNAIRIIALTVIKLDDDQVNKLLADLPFCSYFTNLACFFRDKIMDIDKDFT